MPILLADFIYIDDAFTPGLALDMDAATGRIARILPAADVANSADVITLPRRALLPGFVNAHSHTFQRLLRGRTHWRANDSPDADFWSWRELMYQCALTLSPQDIFDVSRFCFMEMLRAGYTTVGEFHYLQRAPDGSAYDNPNELAQQVIRAAQSVGMRICLLNVCYATGAIGQPLKPEQRRFATPDLDAFLLATEALVAQHSNDALVSVGVAPHSIRAVPRDWLARLRDFAAGHGLPVHMHLSEQPLEVSSCLTEYGMSPGRLLAEEGMFTPRFTGVHCTHLDAEEVVLMAQGRSIVCACPSTERDLGDGIMRAREMVQAGMTIAIGTDSQTVIAPLEEIRALENHERLRSLRRVALTRPRADGRREVAPVLLDAGTLGGARSLGIDAGRLQPGALADVVAIDLDHISVAGTLTPDLAACIALSASPDVVTDVWVGGVQRVAGRLHALEADATRAFVELSARTVS